MKKFFVVSVLVALACTQYTARQVIVHKADGAVMRIVVEREESGTLFVDPKTGDTKFVVKSKNEDL